MSRLSWQEASLLDPNEVQVIDGEPYRLMAFKRCQEGGKRWIELRWQHEVAVFLDKTMVKFPGNISFHRLRDILDSEQLDFEVIKLEVVEEEE